MNKIYIIEDNLDFKSEMLKNENNTICENNTLCENNKLDSCLISQQPLTKTHITLPCNHKFNYMPLYNETCNQKKKNVYIFRALKVNQIKCPYCRTVFDELLPFFPSEINEKNTGVNYPFKYCMKSDIECDWVNKKGIKCVKQALYIHTKCYCKLHHKRLQNINDKI